MSFSIDKSQRGCASRFTRHGNDDAFKRILRDPELSTSNGACRTKVERKSGKDRCPKGAPDVGAKQPDKQSQNKEPNMADTVSSSAGEGDLEASDANQAALEGRFQALYIKMMEKQVEFKEAVEPFKTDNQNAGKG